MTEASLEPSTLPGIPIACLSRTLKGISARLVSGWNRTRKGLPSKSLGLLALAAAVSI